MDFLHHHHEGEDTGLDPMVRRKDPSLAPLLDAMDAEHHRITPAMDELTAAARAWSSDPGAQDRVLAAVAALRAVLDPHLRHEEEEEEEVMPLVQRSVTEREWADWERSANIKTRRPRSWPSRAAGSSTVRARPTAARWCTRCRRCRGS